MRGDFRCVEPVVRATQGIDAVIHLGGIVGDPACALDEDLTLETNLAATSLLAEVCRGAGISRLLFASSCSVYGTAEEIVDEGVAAEPGIAVRGHEGGFGKGAAGGPQPIAAPGDFPAGDGIWLVPPAAL